MRSIGLLLVLAFAAAACGAPSSENADATTSSSGEATTTTTAPSGTLPEGPSALDDMHAPEFPEPLVEPTEIRSGGPPPDGIPPIEDPVFLPAEEGDAWIGQEEPVVVIEIDGDARAYPVQVMIWHEIVNDEVGGVPVAVTYCPLCNSAVAYERVIEGVETTFGTSGRLYNSALVMYDRATETLWTHFDGRAVVGLLAGHELEMIPAPLMAWSDFRDAYPDGVVLDRDSTGFSRDYGRNPYVGYDDPDAAPFLFRGDVDTRAVAMQRVVGVTIEGESVAWTLEAVSGAGYTATQGEVGGTEVVVFWKPGQRTALEDDDVSDGRDVGSVGVFERMLADGTVLTFEGGDDGFRDLETGSTWDITGHAVAGELEGRALSRVAHLDTFWFAWSTYQPGTDLIDE